VASFCERVFAHDIYMGLELIASWGVEAYHDMATHNITDGTGGLDASIFYELDRPEVRVMQWMSIANRN
jgi:hypothetical protein